MKIPIKKEKKKVDEEKKCVPPCTLCAEHAAFNLPMKTEVSGAEYSLV